MARSRTRKYISRIDTPSTHGWYVRVPCAGRIIEPKLFSDGVWGGKRKAMAAATAHRDRICSKLFGGVPDTRRHAVWGKGISYREYQRPDGYVRRDWVAFWSENGRQRTASFAVGRYGYNGARREALKKRKEMVESLGLVPRPVQR